MDEDDPDLKALACRLCHEIIGQEVDVNGLCMLRMGGMVLYDFHGYHECADGQRTQVHWSSGEVLMRRILRRKQGSGNR